MLETPSTSQIKVKKWNTQYGDIPSNHFVVRGDFTDDRVFGLYQPDLVLAQTKGGHVQIAQYLKNKFGLPFILLEHCTPTPSTIEQPERIKEIKRDLSGDINVFISEYNRDLWGFSSSDGVVINHAIQTDIFRPKKAERKNVILSVANEYAQRDMFLNYTQYKDVVVGLPTKLVGNNPGLSEPAKSVDDLVQHYSESRIFLNTAHFSPIPMSLLEAMACQCACVSCDASAIPEYIEHGVNGFLAKNNDEMKHYLKLLLEDEKLAKSLGKAARKTILQKCNLQEFQNSWEQTFYTLLKNY